MQCSRCCCVFPHNCGYFNRKKYQYVTVNLWSEKKANANTILTNKHSAWYLYSKSWTQRVSIGCEPILHRNFQNKSSKCHCCEFIVLAILGFSSVAKGGRGGHSPPIGMPTKMQNKKNTTFLALLRLSFALD